MTQTIKIDDEDWRVLNVMKNPGDSFADVVARVIEFYKWKHPAWGGVAPPEFEIGDGQVDLGEFDTLDELLVAVANEEGEG